MSHYKPPMEVIVVDEHDAIVSRQDVPREAIDEGMEKYFAMGVRQGCEERLGLSGLISRLEPKEQSIR